MHDLITRFPNNDACLQYLFEYKYPQLICPKCKRIGAFHRDSYNASFQCNCGQYMVYPRQGTIFAGSSTDLSKWFLAIYLIANTRAGFNAKELERQVGVTYKTAWRMRLKINEVIMKHVTMSDADIAALKRGIKTKHHSVSADLERLYLSEFQFRSKHIDENPFMLLLSWCIGKAGKI